MEIDSVVFSDGGGKVAEAKEKIVRFKSTEKWKSEQ